jgi:hypothetical protein
LKKLRHFALESALVDKNPEKTIENWGNIVTTIAKLVSMDTSVALASANAALALHNAAADLSSAFGIRSVAKKTFDPQLDEWLSNTRFCSSYAMRVYFEAIRESCTQTQALKAAHAVASSALGKAKNPSLLTLSPYIALLHAKKVGNAFLNGATELNLAPFVSVDGQGRAEDDEGFVKAEAENKAFFKRLDFFAEIYNFEFHERGKEWKDGESNLAMLELDLQRALLIGSAINNAECLKTIAARILGNDASAQAAGLDRGQQLVIAYAINTAAKMGIAVNERLLGEFIELSQTPGLYNSQLLKQRYEKLKEMLQGFERYISLPSAHNISELKSFDSQVKAAAARYKHCAYVVSIDGSTCSEDQLLEMMNSCFEVKLNYPLVDLRLNQITEIAGKGGVAAKDFDGIIDQINKDYSADKESQEHIAKIIRSIRVSGSAMGLAEPLILSFDNLKKLNTPIRRLALAKLAALVTGGVTEESLVDLLKMLDGNAAAGLLTNFAEAVAVLKAKNKVLPANLLYICIRFLSSCNKGIKTPRAKISLAQSFLLGYNKALVVRSVAVAAFHALPPNLFDSLEVGEVGPFVRFDKTVSELEAAQQAYKTYYRAAEGEKTKLQTALQTIEMFERDIPSSVDILEAEQFKLRGLRDSQLALAKQKDEITAKIDFSTAELASKNAALVEGLQSATAELKELQEKSSVTEAKVSLADRSAASAGAQNSQEIRKKIAAIEVKITVNAADSKEATKVLRASLTSNAADKAEIDSKVEKQTKLVAGLSTKVDGLKAAQRKCLQDNRAIMPGALASFREQHGMLAAALKRIDTAITDVIQAQTDSEEIVAAAQKLVAKSSGAVAAAEVATERLQATKNATEAFELKQQFVKEKKGIFAKIVREDVGDLGTIEREFIAALAGINHFIPGLEESRPASGGLYGAAEPVSGSLSALSASSSASAASNIADSIDAIAFHMSMDKVLAKRVGAEKYLWAMVNSILLSKEDLTEAHTAIMYTNDILEDCLHGEANIVFKAIIKHYSARPKDFMALSRALATSKELEHKQQALVLKLIYVYIENGESIEGIIGLIDELQQNGEKRGLLETRLIYPHYWSIADIISKNASDLEVIKCYPRVPIEYAKFDAVKSKFSTLTSGNDLFGPRFQDSLTALDSDVAGFRLPELQESLAKNRERFRAASQEKTAEPLSDIEILTVVVTVTEVLARVSFDVNADGNKQAKELRLEQLMSVFAWLKLGFSGDKSADTIWNQVATGEGKSRITAVAAGAAAVLSGGKTIEMAFNSPYLALRGVDEFALLFKQLFSINGFEADIGVITEAKVSPAAYKTSSPGKQAINFVSTADFILAAKASDVALVKYIQEKYHKVIDEQFVAGAVFLVDSKFEGAVQELFSMGVASENVKVTSAIEKEIIACKAQDADMSIVVLSSRIFDDVTFIDLGSNSAMQAGFTDDNGVLRVVDEADYGSDSFLPCNISSHGDGNGYWDSPKTDDGIYYYIAEWAMAKLQEDPSLLSESLGSSHLADFKDFVAAGESGNPNRASLAIVTKNLAGLQLLQLQTWFKSATNARGIKQDVHFILEPGHRGEYGEECSAIVPLTEGGAAMRGTTFSNGVHQILRYLLNSGQAEQVTSARSIADRCLSVLGWGIKDRLVDPRQDVILAKPFEAPIVASECDILVLPQESRAHRKSNVHFSLKTTGTAPRHIAVGAGHKFLHTPRATDLNRKHLPTVVVVSAAEHIQAIIRDVQQCKLDARPAFVLCKDERESKLVSEILESMQELEGMSIQNYSSLLDQSVKEKMIRLAGVEGTVTVGPIVDLGRGVDVKPTATAKEHGGLHLIMTHNPKAKATHEQGIARSGRNGDLGTECVITRGNITGEAAIASQRQACSRLSGIKQIHAAYTAPLRLFEIKRAEALKSGVLAAKHQDKIDNLYSALYLRQSTKEHEVNSEIVAAITKSWFKSWGLKRAGQILQAYNADIIESYNKELGQQFVGEPNVISAMTLSADAQCLSDILTASLNYLDKLPEEKISLQQVPVVAEYAPSHAGQAVVYANPLWFIDATLKGHNVLGDHLAALFRGGDFFPNLKACFVNWRILPPVIAELVEYFKLESGSNDKKVVVKSLLKILSYTAFLGAMIAAPLLGSSLVVLIPTVLACSGAGIILHYKSAYITVKEHAKNVDIARIQALLARNDRVDINTTYIAPRYIRKASQILVYALFFAIVGGAYIICTPYFYGVYAAVASKTLLDYAFIHSSIFSVSLMFGMYCFYTEKGNEQVFSLPENLYKDARSSLARVFGGFGLYMLALSFGLVATYFMLSSFSFLLYNILVIMGFEYFSFLVLGTVMVLTGFILIPLVISSLVVVGDFMYRLLKGEVAVTSILKGFEKAFKLFATKIVPIMHVLQFGFMVYTGFFILMFAFPPVIILGANFVPLINAGILSVYALCCVEQTKYLVAQMFYLSSLYIKKAIIILDPAKAEAYATANESTLVGKGMLILLSLRDNGFWRAISPSKAMNDQDTASKLCPMREEKKWISNNSAEVSNHNSKLLLQPIKALCAWSSSFVVYSFIISMSSLPLGIALAAAVAIYTGILVDGFVEDLYLNLVFGRKSDFSYILLPEIIKAYREAPVTDPAAGDTAGKDARKQVFTRMYYAKLIAQKTFNFLVSLLFAPIYFGIATVMLPIKFIGNFFAKDNGQIVNIQFANLLSFVIAVLFLFMTTSVPPLIVVCMALYINSIVSYGVMRLLNVFKVDTSKNGLDKLSLSIGTVTELFFGCDVAPIIEYEKQDGGVFKGWVDSNAKAIYSGDNSQGGASCPLGQILNFKRH